jgi:hypothetical protein
MTDEPDPEPSSEGDSSPASDYAELADQAAYFRATALPAVTAMSDVLNSPVINMTAPDWRHHLASAGRALHDRDGALVGVRKISRRVGPGTATMKP